MSRLIIQMGTTVSSQVLNMIIYILMVQQSLGLEQKIKKVDRIGESFILFSVWTHPRHREPWVEQRGRFGQGTIIQSPHPWLPEGLAAMCDLEVERFFYFIFPWLFSSSFPTSCSPSLLGERTRKEICKWLIYFTDLFMYLFILR